MATYTVIYTFSVLEIWHVNLSVRVLHFSMFSKKIDTSLYVWKQNPIFSFSSSAFIVCSIETVATFSTLTSDIMLEIASPLSYFCSCLSPHHVVVGFRFSFSYLEIVGNYKQSFIYPITLCFSGLFSGWPCELFQLLETQINHANLYPQHKAADFSIVGPCNWTAFETCMSTPPSYSSQIMLDLGFIFSVDLNSWNLSLHKLPDSTNVEQELQHTYCDLFLVIKSNQFYSRIVKLQN